MPRSRRTRPEWPRAAGRLFDPCGGARNAGVYPSPVDDEWFSITLAAYGVLEWEMLSTVICTHLTKKYDELFKQRVEAIFEDE